MKILSNICARLGARSFFPSINWKIARTELHAEIFFPRSTTPLPLPHPPAPHVRHSIYAYIYIHTYTYIHAHTYSRCSVFESWHGGSSKSDRNNGKSRTESIRFDTTGRLQARASLPCRRRIAGAHGGALRGRRPFYIFTTDARELDIPTNTDWKC